MSVKAAKDTPITVNGKDASLKDVRPGMRVRVFENAKRRSHLYRNLGQGGMIEKPG